MAIKTATELKAYFETGDVPTQAQFVDLIDTIFSAVPDYKVYTALLTQSGTSAPVSHVLKNTLGYTPTFNYDGSGQYSITLQNAPYLKIYTEYIYINTVFDDGDYTIKIISEDDNLITIATRVASTGIHTDLDIINNFPIEIRVYN